MYVLSGAGFVGSGLIPHRCFGYPASWALVDLASTKKPSVSRAFSVPISIPLAGLAGGERGVANIFQPPEIPLAITFGKQRPPC